MLFRNQHQLRQIFIAGHIIGIALFFLPLDAPPSELEYTRYMLSGANSAEGLFKLAQITGRVAFLALTIYRPRRWVFIAGAAWASLILGSNIILGIRLNTLYETLGHAQLLMRMTGFFIK